MNNAESSASAPFLIKLVYVAPPARQDKFKLFVAGLPASPTIRSLLPALAERVKEIENFRVAPEPDSLVISDPEGCLEDFNQPLAALEPLSLVSLHAEERERLVALKLGVANQSTIESIAMAPPPEEQK